MAALTDARNAVWDAIDNAAALADVFAQKFKLNDEMFLWNRREPSISDLPAIMITPRQIDPQWVLNVAQEYPYLLVVTIWTADFYLPQAEDLAEKVWKAIYQTGPSATVSYVQAATGYRNKGGIPVTFEPMFLGDNGEGQNRIAVIKTELSVLLRLRQNPFTA